MGGLGGTTGVFDVVGRRPACNGGGVEVEALAAARVFVSGLGGPTLLRWAASLASLSLSFLSRTDISLART